MKTRNLKKTSVEINAPQFEEAMARYAEAGKREAAINKDIEANVNRVFAVYEDELAGIAHSKNLAFGIIQAYCINNKSTLFAKRRSMGTLHGVVGFRLGTPKLRTAKGTDWKKVLAELKAKLPDYVRVTEEPARDLLLANRHKENVAPMLMSLGIEIVQDELFYFDTAKAA